MKHYNLNNLYLQYELKNDYKTKACRKYVIMYLICENIINYVIKLHMLLSY